MIFRLLKTQFNINKIEELRIGNCILFSGEEL